MRSRGRREDGYACRSEQSNRTLLFDNSQAGGTRTVPLKSRSAAITPPRPTRRTSRESLREPFVCPELSSQNVQVQAQVVASSRRDASPWYVSGDRLSPKRISGEVDCRGLILGKFPLKRLALWLPESRRVCVLLSAQYVQVATSVAAYGERRLQVRGRCTGVGRKQAKVRPIREDVHCARRASTRRHR